MRKFMLLGAFSIAALLPAGESQAYEGPWCAVIDLGASTVYENCSMRSFEMCREEARLGGSTSFCRINGAFPGYRAMQEQPRRAVKHKARRHYHR